MTQLDRLEALAEIWQHPGEQGYGIGHVIDALPDLIQVARAAYDAWDMLENDQPGFAQAVLRKDVKSSSLYREVES